MQITAAAIRTHVSVAIEVSQSNDGLCFGFAGDDEGLLPIFFRRRQYFLPAEVVQTPMPTLTCRHLEKAVLHLLDGRQQQALLAFKRAVVSAIDPASLIKVALACHTESHNEEALLALERARKYAVADPALIALIDAIAGHLGQAVAL